MSYLDTPRLHFAGRFQADVSTVNNDPEHFNVSGFRSSFDLLQNKAAMNGWWNPRGTGAWRFFGCTVQRVVYQDGSSTDDGNVDPVVGAALNGSDDRVEGKLVDLDPEQQMVSEIWGFEIVLRRAHPEGIEASPLGFRGAFEAAAFADLWGRFPQGQPDAMFGAFYQSVLRSVRWFGHGGSRFLRELQGSGPGAEALSIKFNVDGIDQDSGSATFTFGRVVGTIGPYVPGEPTHVVSGRALAQAGAAPAGTAYATVKGERLTIDLGNALPTQSAGGALASQGNLYLAVAGRELRILGRIGYEAPEWYPQTAGVVGLNLTPEQAQAVASNPLVVTPLPSNPLLAEAPDGTFVRADTFVFRFDPGQSQTAELVASAFGAPAANRQISLGYDASIMQGQTTQGLVPGPQSVGKPESALTFPASVTTDADGTARVLLTAADPGAPRTYIDGQVYGVTYALGPSPPPPGSIQNSSQVLSALVFSGYQVPDEPTWLDDVQPIFTQYANLYPIMRSIVDLSSFSSVVSRRRLLQQAFATPVSSPAYMPVTRDLSGAKRQMIRKWLENPVYMRLDSKPDLLQALQRAVELEHATIPPYLTALYSIKDGTNVEVASLIRSVVLEEMLHMALASNILIAIGGAPDIDRPGFVPAYPGPLPGGLRGDLVVRLRRCSVAQIRDVFMSIERPADTPEPVHGNLGPQNPSDLASYTIGWFYDEIEKALRALTAAGAITFGYAERQVTGWTAPGQLFAITSLEDACRAIREIKEQGEGASPRDPDDAEHELAHYYKFAEIVAGRRLVPNAPGSGFAFTGDPIPFEEDGVWPMIDDPDVTLYPAGSRAAILADQFARTYQTLLKALHRTFNGEPNGMRDAIGVMYALDLAARELMRTPSGITPGTTAGPVFQLPVPGLA
jgi:hypothetical protein